MTAYSICDTALAFASGDYRILKKYKKQRHVH